MLETAPQNNKVELKNSKFYFKSKPKCNFYYFFSMVCNINCSKQDQMLKIGYIILKYFGIVLFFPNHEALTDAEKDEE